MSLDYDLTVVPTDNWKDSDGKMSEMTYCIIHSMPYVKLRKITEENVSEFVKRQKQMNDLWGHYGWKLKGEENYLFTEEDVRKYIGLITNVGTADDAAWQRYFKLQRVYKVFRAHNHNEVPNNVGRMGIRYFSCRGLSAWPNSKLHKELLEIGGEFAEKPDELGNLIWVYQIESYE